jgi:hypothetical protein
MDPQHRGQRVGRPAAIHTRFGVVGFDQIKQCFPRHYLLHLAQKSLTPGALLGRGLLVITIGEAMREAVTDLLASHEPSPCLRVSKDFARMAWVFQSLPKCCCSHNISKS